MKRMNLLLLTIWIISINLYGQLNPIDVAELTLKIGGLGSDELYYGFAEGDKIVFSFNEEYGRELKEIEIIELPTSSKYMDFKSTRVENKIIDVYKDGVYLFKFTNSTLGGRICNVKIQRIPKSEELISFNTDWKWKTIYDTTYIPYSEDSLIGYDTIYIQKEKKALIAIDTIITELCNKTERVHSATAIGKTQDSYLDVYLPQNIYTPNRFNTYQSTEVVAWSYWLGVGQRAKEDYEAANKNLSAGITTIGALTGYGALASLAVTGISMFGTPTVGDNVQYRFITVQNGVEKILDFGNGIAASGRNTNLLQGGFRLHMHNDNFREGIDVTVKVIAVQVRKTWEDQQYTEEMIEPKYLTLNKRRMVVETSQIRVNAD